MKNRLLHPQSGTTALLLSLFLALPVYLPGQSATQPSDEETHYIGEDDIVTLEEFSVSSKSLRDEYIASESTSGTRMAEKVVDLPYVVSTFTEQFMEDFLLEDEDLLSFLPGATGDTGESGGEGTDGGEARVRGFKYKRIRDGFLYALPSGPSNSAGSEYLAGPASIFYGRTSPGGIMNYKTRRPSTKSAYGTTLVYGSNGTRRIGASATGPLKPISPKLYYRAYVDYKRDLGRYQVDKMENSKYYAGIQFLYRFRKDSSLNLSLEYQYHDDVEGGPTTITTYPEGGGLRPRGYRNIGDFNPYWGPDAYRKGDYYGAQLLFEHRINSIWATRAAVNYYDKNVEKLRYSGGGSFYEYHEVLMEDPNDPSNKIPDPINSLGALVFAARAPYYNDFREQAGAFQSELVGQFRTRGISHRIMFGVDAALSERDSLAKGVNGDLPTYYAGRYISLDPNSRFYYRNPGSGYYDPIPRDIITRVSTDYTLETTSFGAFSSYRAALLRSRLITMASVRYDYLKDERENRVGNYYDSADFDPNNPVPPEFDPYQPHPGPNPAKGVLKEDKISYSIGFNYRFGEYLHFYSSYNTCFEPQNTIDHGTNAVIPPRTGKSLEIGFKGANDANTLGYTLSLYDTTLTNIAVSNDEWRDGVDNGSGKPEYDVDGKQRSRGAQIELFWKTPLNGLSFRGAFSYLHNRVIFQGNDTASHRQGEPAINVAPWAGSLIATYRFSSSSLLKGLSISLAGTWRDRVTYYYETSTIRGEEAPSLFLLRGNMVYRFKTGSGRRKFDHRITLNCINILDKQYYTRQGRENFGFSTALTYKLSY